MPLLQHKQLLSLCYLCCCRCCCRWPCCCNQWLLTLPGHGSATAIVQQLQRLQLTSRKSSSSTTSFLSSRLAIFCCSVTGGSWVLSAEAAGVCEAGSLGAAAAAHQAVYVFVPPSLGILVVHQEGDKVLCIKTGLISIQDRTTAAPAEGRSCLSPHHESSACPVCWLVTPWRPRER